MTLINTGCGLAGLRSLDPGSVDLVFCDLPSGETRASFDNPIDLAEFWPAAWACLKPAGAVVLMASSFRYGAAVIASEPKWYRYDVVWEKGRATGVLNAASQPMRAHEFLLIFYRSPGTYNPQKTTGHDPMSSWVQHRRVSENYGRQSGTSRGGGKTDRMPRSVVKTKSIDNKDGCGRRHPQQKPIPLLQWVVRTYTNPGEMVAEPCCGSGSMCEAALGDNRRYVGWDFDPKPPSAFNAGLPFGGQP